MEIFLNGIGAAWAGGGARELEQLLDTDTPQKDWGEAPTDALIAYVPQAKMRRMDHFTRLVLLSAYRCIEDANLVPDALSGLALVLATGHGPALTTFKFLDSLTEQGPLGASPLAFSTSVHNIPGAVLAMTLGTPCPCTTICQLIKPVGSAFEMSICWLKDRRSDAVLVTVCDELSEVMDSIYNCLAKETGQSAPLRAEGAASFLLGRKPGPNPIGKLKFCQAANGVPPNRLASILGESPTIAGLELAAATSRFKRNRTASSELIIEASNAISILALGD
jgi:hypothetical protein